MSINRCAPASGAILVLRGQRVLLDVELAAFYGVATKALNQAVERNTERFPEDLMFRLTRAETEELNRSQFVTGSQKHRDPRFPPYAFTEHGAIMAASILNSPRATMSRSAPFACRQSHASHSPLRKPSPALRQGGANQLAAGPSSSATASERHWVSTARQSFHGATMPLYSFKSISVRS